MNNRTGARALALVATVMTTTLCSTTAHAAPPAGDYVLAVTSTETDMARAVADAVAYNLASPVDCGVPLLVGVAVLPPTDFVVGELYGTDVATGQGLCVGPPNLPYVATLVVKVQWMDTLGIWSDIPQCDSSFTISAVYGVAAPVVAPYPCRYSGDPGGPAGRPHRVYAELTHTYSPAPIKSYSPVYLSADELSATSG